MRKTQQCYRFKEDELILNIHAQTRAKTEAISGLYSDRIKVKIKSPPVDNKANQEIINLFAREFGVSKSHVSINTGQHNRDKTIAILSPQKEPVWFQELSGKL